MFSLSATLRAVIAHGVGFFLLAWLGTASVWAQAITQQIIVDQFGWRTNARKTVVFANPVSGQNSGNTYTPGSQFQVRRSADNSVVFTGTTVIWNSGNTHTDSGDKAWHGDFTSVTTPGTYHIYDPTRNLRSYDFEIRDNIYGPVLQAAVKVFYYQRSGTAIPAQYGGNWTHPLAHSQDANALLYTSSAQSGTTRNVTGGWYDAGDYNKYIPFLAGPMWDLLMAYELRPNAFIDATNIPESGNGVPDVLDELKWELDWMLRMQATNGGVHNRVAVTSYSNGTDDPSTDTQPRYYTNITTWSTATFAAIMAHASRVFGAYGTQFPNYATTLQTAAENAWTYLENNPNISPSTGTDGASMAAADAGSNSNQDRRLRILAAAQLFRTTGTAKYKTYFESNYNNTTATSENGFHPLSNGYMDPSVCWDLNQAFIIYWATPGANTTIVSQLKNTLKTTMDWFHEPYYTRKDDPYLAYMWTGHYTWGSNQLKARWGQLAVIALEASVNSAKNSLYREIAEEYLHYFHGRNPLSWVYLSNMGSRGANVGGDKNIEEFYHSWFRNGSARYDGPGSQFGAAPGYVVGGPNQNYSGTTTPPKGNPPMKAFAAWNADYPDPSWEVTEPAIYYQAAYVFLSSYFAEPAPVQPSLTASSNSPICAGQTLNLTATPANLSGSITYTWSGPNGFSATVQNPTIPNATTALSGTYSVTATSNGSRYTASTRVLVSPVPTASASSNSPVAAGQTLNLFAATAGTGAAYSWKGPNNMTATVQNPSIANVTTAAAGTYTLTVGLNGCSSTATTSVTVTGVSASTYLIYDDALKTGWVDWSWGTTRNLSNTSLVQSGSRSISVTYTQAWGGLYLHTDSPVSLSSFSHLKFWVNGGKQGGQKITVKMNSDNSNVYSLTIPKNNWTLVTVPLSVLGNPAALSDLYFQEGLGSTKQPVFYLDQIYLASSATARESVGLTPGSLAAGRPDVRIYPNPVDGQQGALTLQFIGFRPNEEVQLTLTDLQGRSLQQVQLTLTSPEKEVALGRLSPGYYLIRVLGEGSRQVKKLLVK
ncbi:hypothetical protein GCM10023187_19870 [Nibrella viscosa]|uniref:Immunoglobulin domain-containing protein n=1 Tax=Nibrella viscosa TaxID=1084524 RepID=A0ABP8KBP9_9BACT